MTNNIDFEDIRSRAQAALKDRHILVLCGGDDAEADVSLAAANSVAAGLQRLGLRHETVGPDALLDALRRQPDAVVINILYGPTGEGGAFAGLFQAMGVAATYSDTASSAIALDKWRTKILLQESGVRATWSVFFDAHTWRAAAVDVSTRAAYPVVCKPLKLGCSIGIDIARDDSELETLLKKISTDFGPGLVEPFLPGDEFSVAVLQPPGHAPFALPPLQLRYSAQALATSDIKYGRGELSLECPALIPASLEQELSRMAVAAFEGLGCHPLVRVDFRCDGNGVPYLLEVNHHPGMTPHSWFPLIASRAGIEYDVLLLTLLHAATTRLEQSQGDRVQLLHPANVGLSELPRDEPSRIAVSLMSTAAVDVPELQDWRTMPPLALASCRVSRGAGAGEPLLDLLFEEPSSTPWRATLDSLGYRRLGPSLLACALAEDKRRQRQFVAGLGVPQPQWQSPQEWAKGPAEGTWVAKRRCSNQSRDVHLITAATTDVQALVQGHPQDWIIERYVAGDEFHVGVVTSPAGRMTTLPVARIPASAEPWLLDEARKSVPERIPLEFQDANDPFVAEIVEISRRLVQAFDAPPVTRVEWRRGVDGRPCFLEFDHCAGIGQQSIVTRMLRQAGVTLLSALHAPASAEDGGNS